MKKLFKSVHILDDICWFLELDQHQKDISIQTSELLDVKFVWRETAEASVTSRGSRSAGMFLDVG